MRDVDYYAEPKDASAVIQRSRADGFRRFMKPNRHNSIYIS